LLNAAAYQSLRLVLDQQVGLTEKLLRFTK
jgi:hypothetical protein